MTPSAVADERREILRNASTVTEAHREVHKGSMQGLLG